MLKWSRFRKTIGKHGHRSNYLTELRNLIAAGMSLAVGHWMFGTGIRLALMKIWNFVFFQNRLSTIGRNCQTFSFFLLSGKAWFTFRQANPHPSISGNFGGLIWPLVAGGLT